ncbi:hypothetical protein ACQ4PT_041040 [Festuca glaucescens]
MEAQDVFGLGLSPGFKFEPDDDELVEQYLLRRILGQQLPLEGVILKADPLSAPPWKLLKEHNREDDAFFFSDVQTKHSKGTRQKRTCVDKGGCWEGQKAPMDGERLRVGTDEITWKKYMLNFHEHGVKGSTGWVMHEYSITAPDHLASSSLRLYRIRLSGHGKNSKRERGDDGGAQERADEPDHVSAANYVFPAVEVVDLLDDEDDGSARPAAMSCSDQDYLQYQRDDCTQQDYFQDLGDYAGPGAANLGTHGGTQTSDQGAPCVMNEYDGAAPAAGMLTFGQGSFSGDEPFMGFEMLDQDINLDEFMDFELPDQLDFNIEDPYALEAPLHDNYSNAAMQTQPWM